MLFAHFGARADPHLLHFAREFGLILFVYAVGIDVGPRFLTAFRSDGPRLNLLAAAVVFLGFAIAWAFHASLGVEGAVIVGVMSGAMTAPPALEFANGFAPVQAQSAAYATVYPLTMFLRILFVQVLVLATL